MAQITLHTAFGRRNIAPTPTAQPVVLNIPQTDYVAQWDEQKVSCRLLPLLIREKNG